MKCSKCSLRNFVVDWRPIQLRSEQSRFAVFLYSIFSPLHACCNIKIWYILSSSPNYSWGRSMCFRAVCWNEQIFRFVWMLPHFWQLSHCYWPALKDAACQVLCCGWAFWNAIWLSGSYRAKCVHCGAAVSGRGQTTSNLHTHLERKCPRIHEQAMTKKTIPDCGYDPARFYIRNIYVKSSKKYSAEDHCQKSITDALIMHTAGKSHPLIPCWQPTFPRLARKTGSPIHTSQP